MDVQALKDELSIVLTHLKGVGLVHLFGSQVDGMLGAMSDCELAVLVDRAHEGRRVQTRLAHELARALQTERVDVVLLGHASIESAQAVIAQGKLIYERDVAMRVEYEATVLSRYGDYLPVLRAGQRASQVPLGEQPLDTGTARSLTENDTRDRRRCDTHDPCHLARVPIGGCQERQNRGESSG